ncbi:MULTISPECIES: hypothetical protein [Cryobacterium]|uniref:IPT/TIG domain-containing protein n=1 Tax=Cryobacterium breve TaxID=1259258 RepID=A0ABY2J7G0_9MICO|nr:MULTISPECIES: hypothetical protein [Cryobacterium]TFC92040.1 hypothetical protein E3T20_12045 [Cryobacterium sp. TmT3-12]TFC99821.1 hypothetical protein E3O65_05460 [Cryobacterium breve]
MPTTIFDAEVPTAGTIALAHEEILRIKRSGSFENVAGDINALVNTPAPITVAREAYGLKGTDSVSVIGYNQVITFTAEGIRDNLGRIAQPWLVALLKIARSTGAANKVSAQTFDAKDENLIALEGSYSVTAVKSTTGFKDKFVWAFTLTNDGPVVEIPSPIAGTGVPVLDSALPSGAVASANIYVRGYNVGAITAATIGGVAVTSISQIPNEPNIVVLEVPAGAAGSAPLILTNAVGASASFPYVRGA